MLNESSDWKKEFTVFANYYYEDFPNFNALDAELDLWFSFWDFAKFKNNLPDCFCDTEKGWLASFPKFTFDLKTVRYFAYHNL